MAELYRVCVVSTDRIKRTVHLRVWIVHPDERDVYEHVSWAFQLLWDGVRDRPDSAFYQAVEASGALESDAIRDPKWVFIKSRMYLDAMKIFGKVHIPVPDEYPTGELRNDEDALPHADIKVVLYDAAWVGDFAEGQMWDSAAYDVSKHIGSR